MKTKASKSSAILGWTVSEKLICVRVRAWELPPVKDGLLIGKETAIGGEAMTRTLRLMTKEGFDRIVLKDDIVQEVIVRSAVLRKTGEERLVAVVKKRTKPIMAETELLMLDSEIEMLIEDTV